MKYCSKCGHQNDDSAAFCASCGAPFSTTSNPPAERAQPHAQAHPQAQTQSQAPQARPNNQLVWAILTTLLCCLPAGVVSIVYATKVDSHYNAGDYAAAEKAAKNARTWAIVSAVAGFVVGIVYLLIMIAAEAL